MVTKGIIKSIDLKGNTCTVHMPFFETAGNDPIIGTAIISNTPGSYNGYKVGDVVLVAFEDGAMETPVVMGKLYLGAEVERADPRGVLNVENSTVSKSATMPADTKLAAQIDNNVPNTTVPYGSLSSIANELNTLNTNVGQMDRDYGNKFKQVITSIGEQGEDLTSKIEQSATEISAEVSKKLDAKSNGTNNKEGEELIKYGFGWELDNDGWTIKAFDQNNEGSLPEDGLDIFKITRDEVVINTPYVTLSGYPKETKIRYAYSDSTTKHPDAYKDADASHTDENNIGDAWTEEIPVWQDGKYIWKWTQRISYEYDKDYESSTGIAGKWDKVSASDHFECLAGTSAISLWLNCSTTSHAGSQQKEKIEITAMAKVGTSSEEEDKAATLEYRWGLDGELISANGHKLVIENTKTNPIPDKNLIVIAKRNGNVYSSATIYFSPLNTPILILSEDGASIAYNSYGDTKIEENACVKIEAKVLLNNKEMSDVKYSWKLEDCTNDTIISESTSWGTTITDTNNISIYHIAEASSYATVICTAAYEDNLGNETKLEKTFTITKNLQGKAQYKLDIFNEFVTFPVNYDTTEITGIEDLTTHDVSALYGDIPVEFISYIEGSAPTTFEAKQFYLKVVPSNNITLNPEIEYSNTLQTKLTNNITRLNGEAQTTGYITYELYRGTIKVASAKFEISMIHNGTPVTRSWLVIDKLVHTGATETKTITIQPKIETGNSGADNDLTATIECRYLGEIKPDGTLGEPSSIPAENIERNSTTGDVLIKCPFKNQDIEIKAKHGNSVYETEIITYIPQDTPGLDLDNDGDFIPYTPSGNKIGTSTVKSKARLLLNQEEINDITYTWTLDGCVLKDDDNEVKLTTFTGQTIEIEYLTKEHATATCKVIYLGKEYSKTFSIVKQISAASYWVAVSQPVHSGAEQDIALTACAKKNEGLVVETDDEGAILWYRFKDDTTWTKSVYNFKLEMANASFKDQDLYIIATHDSNFEPDENTIKTEDDIYAWETIMFSSSTPVLNFEPDVGFIIYDAENTKLNTDNNKAIVTAGLYKNGLLLPANEVTYLWTPESCSGEQDSSDPAKYTVNEINANANIAKVKCEATYAGRKYTNEFTVIKQVNATTYWIKTSCLVHKGAEQQQNVSIIAMRKDGTNPETQDSLAYLWWKYESATEWTQVTGATPYAITLEAGKENGTGKIKPEDILVLATHRADFDPNAEGINILTDANIYDQETIEYSPLDTPTINLDEDRGALVYDADGNKIGNASAKTTAAIWYNGERLNHSNLDFTYNWAHEDGCTCDFKQGKNTNGVYLEVSKISAEAVTFTCTITIGNKGIDGNGAFANTTYTKNFTVVKQIKGDPTIKYDILPSVTQLKAKANGELYDEYGDSITFNIIKSRGLETPKAIKYTAESEATLTVKIAKDGGALENYTQTPDDNNTYTASLLKVDGSKITNSIIIELYNNDVLIDKVTIDVVNDGADGDAASSYWISCPKQHLGKNNRDDIRVKAYKQIGNEISKIDTEAWLRYKVKSTEDFSSWFAIKDLVDNTLTIDKSEIGNENIIIQAAHSITSDGASIYNEYDEEIIDYTPLNTPTLVIDGDRHVIRYLLNGNDLEKLTEDVTSTAAVYEGLTELTNISYNWSVKNSEDSANITFSDQDTNTITISDIKANRVVIVCTATVNERFDDLGNAFVVQKEITVDKEVLISNYRLKISTPIHTGATQLDSIKVEALATLGNESEKPDEKAYLRYSLDNGATWNAWVKQSELEILASDCKSIDDNIIIQYSHDETTILESETITYSPLNTPIIDLTNDTASIAYDVEGNKIEEDDFVVSTAKVWLNGQSVPTDDYEWGWTVNKCTAKSGTQNHTIEIDKLYDTTATATFHIIFKIGTTYAGLELEKEFTISKQIKGDKGDNAVSPYAIDIYNDTVTALTETAVLSDDYDWNSNTVHEVKIFQGVTPIATSEITVKSANNDGTYTAADGDKDLVLTYKLNNIHIDSFIDGTHTNYKKVYYITSLITAETMTGQIEYSLYHGGALVATDSFRFSKILTGISITGVTNKYYATKTATLTEEDKAKTWSNNINDTGYGPEIPYLWNYEIISYSSGNPTTTAPALLGSRGKGIKALSEYYLLTATSGSPSKPTKEAIGNWLTGISAPTQPTSSNPYLWNTEKIEYTDGDVEFTDPALVGTFTRSIKEVKNYYYATASDIASLPDKGGDAWKTTITAANFNATNKYLWNYEEIIYDRAITDGSTDTSKTTDIELISIWSKEILEIKEYYLISKSLDSTTFANEDNRETNWVETLKTPTSAYPYLWNKETTYYTDGTNESTNPIILSTFARSITGVRNYYIATTTETLPSSPDWKTSIGDANFNAINKYLWNYEEITYDLPLSNGNKTSETTPEIISTWSKSIDKIEEYYLISKSNDENNFATESNRYENWSTTAAAPNSSYPYLWNKEATYYTDAPETAVYTDPVIIGTYGETFGVNIIPSVSSIILQQDGTYNPTTINIKFNEVSGTTVTECGDVTAREYKYKLYKIEGSTATQISTDVALTPTNKTCSLDINKNKTTGQYQIELLLKNNNEWVVVDTENIPVVKDGIDGTNAINYWLNIPVEVHKGSKHGENIVVTAMKQTNGTESPDEDAILFYRYNNTSNWTRAAAKYFLDFNHVHEILDDKDIYILATHKIEYKSELPANSVNGVDEDFYDYEVIQYSPENSPILILTNDSASMAYGPDGKYIGLANQKPTSTAELWLNGSKITTGVTYTWTPDNNCTLYSPTTTANITVNELSGANAQITCKATHNGATYTKIFNVARQIKGEPGAPGEQGDSIVAISKQYLLLKDLTYSKVRFKDGIFEGYIEGSKAWEIIEEDTHYNLFTEDFQADLFKEYDQDNHKIFVREQSTYLSGAITYSEFREEKVIEEVYKLKQGKSTNYYGPTDPSTIYNIQDRDCWFKYSEDSYKYIDIGIYSTYDKYADKYIFTGEGEDGYAHISEAEIINYLENGLITEARYIVLGETIAYEKKHIEGKAEELLQWNASTKTWEAVGTDIVENKVTANYVNALDITAKKIEILDDKNGTLFRADGLSNAKTVEIAGFNVTPNYFYKLGTTSMGTNPTTGGTLYSGIGFAPEASKGSWAIWAGPQSGNGSINSEAGSPTNHPYGQDAPFKVGHDGALYSSRGEIAGFNIDSTTISKGAIGEDGSVFVSTGKIATTNIGSSTGEKTWAFTAGNDFGVTTNGTIYANRIILGNKYQTLEDKEDGDLGGSMSAMSAQIQASSADIKTIKSNYVTTLALEAISAKIDEINTENIRVTKTGGDKNNEADLIFKADGRALDSSGNTGPKSDDERVKIGGFTVTPNYLIAVSDKTNGTSTDSNKPLYNGVGIAPEASKGSWAIWAGPQSGNGSDGDNTNLDTGDYPYGQDAPFRVSHDGQMFANIGEIGGWTISKDFISAEDLILDPYNGIKVKGASKIIFGSTDLITTTIDKNALLSSKIIADTIYNSRGEKALNFNYSSTDKYQVDFNMELKVGETHSNHFTGTFYATSTLNTTTKKFCKSVNVDKVVIAHRHNDNKSVGGYAIDYYEEYFPTYWSTSNDATTGITTYSIKVTRDKCFGTEGLINFKANKPVNYFQIWYSIKGVQYVDEISDTSITKNVTKTKALRTISITKADLNESSLDIAVHRSLIPIDNKQSCNTLGFNLGDSSNKWDNIHVKNLFYDKASSDIRIKNNIEELSDSYEKFFDALKPRRFKYNFGTSGRYHTGFIAQEVLQNLTDAGLDTQQFAGISLNDPGKETERWYLWKEDFVPLNTWQIQKLKVKVQEQEEMIKNLQQKLEQLEKRIG